MSFQFIEKISTITMKKVSKHITQVSKYFIHKSRTIQSVNLFVVR